MKCFKYLQISILTLLIVGCKESRKEAKPVMEVATVQLMESPAKVESSLPFLFSNGNKTLLSWVEKEGDSLSILKYAELFNESWLNPKEILRGTDWFVNWADFPMIAENNGSLWSHVLKKSTSGTYSYDVKMNLLSQGQAAWKTNVALHTDGTPTEHGFVTVIPYKDDFFVNWLDGRNTEENATGERGAMTLRAAEVSANGQVASEHQLDARTCDCCQTTAAITTNGPVVIYRDRSEEEVRDISIVRQIDGKWTEPKPVHNDNWKIKGCPVNGPKAAAIGNSLVVAWFTSAQQNSKVQLAFSPDGGANFDDPIRIDEADALGRVDVLLIDKKTAIISWMESEDKQTKLKAIKVAVSGKKFTARTITTIDASRKTGFPQMELVGNKVYFAWTDVVDELSKVKTAYVELDRFQ